MKRNCKCRILLASEYDKSGPIVFEDDKHRYSLGPTGHFIRLRKKSCSLCGSSMSYVIIFEFSGHYSVERFCAEHASQFGELPASDNEQELNKLTNKQKLAIQKWTSIKVNI